MQPGPVVPRPSPWNVVLGLLLLALAGCGGEGNDASVGADTPAAASADEMGQQIVDLSRLGYNEGNPEEAVVRVVEFSDFGCVFCARFHMQDYGILHDEFVAGGDVVWKYVPITIGGFPNGNLAALTAECVGEQGDFAPIRDLLFENRETWIATPTAESGELFRSYAEAVGADMAAWEQCLTGGEASARIEQSNQMASELGVRGTPTFIVEGFPVQGAPPLADFQEALRQMVADLRGPAETPGS
jgi:hypothetical protein